MLLQSLKKEIRLISLDVHSIAVLVLLPVTFMVIMTFALSSQQADVLKAIRLYAEPSAEAHTNQDLLLKYLEWQGVGLSSEEEANATLHISPELKQNLLVSDEPLMELQLSAKMSPQLKTVAQQQLQMAFAKLKLHLFLLDSGMLDQQLPLEIQMEHVLRQTNSEQQIIVVAEGSSLAITEYSIPSWIIFGVYFIVLPISITLLNEEKNGTLIRLKTFPISLNNFFLVKLFSFFCISISQYILLCLIGFLIVPQLVGLPMYSPKLLLQLLPAILCSSLAAVSFAGLVATQIRSYEQAIVVGGGLNIIQAALCGFMVPLDIMPEVMQRFAQWLPMRWSADLLKSAMLSEAMPGMGRSLIYLLVFSLVSLTLTITLFRRKTRNLLWS